MARARASARPWSKAAVGLLLLAFLLQALASMWDEAPTFDELVSPAAGYAEIFTGDFRLIDDHPPLARILMALPLLALRPALPLDHFSWREKEQKRKYRYDFAEQFFYVSNENADRMLFWSRLPVLALSTLLGFLVFVWARELYGASSGLVALYLYAFEPNLMAHSRLATNDLPVALMIFATVFLLWRYHQAPCLKRAALAGVLLGLALLTKFSALALLPIVFLASVFSPPNTADKSAPALANAVSGRILRAGAITALLAVVASFVVLAFYGARWWLFVETLKNGVVHYGAGHVARQGHPAFLLGEVSTAGWWYYFPVAIAVKTPIPLLIFALIAFLTGSFRRGRAHYFLLLPVLVVVFAALTSTLNIGVRHVLPAYPFVIVMASSVATVRFSRPRFFAALLCALGFWYMASTLKVFPSYLAYFNEFVGPENGYRVLVDSNLDWGQDLKRLKHFMDENRIQKIYLSYFGTASPCYYGSRWIALPGSEANCSGQAATATSDYIAISATHLQSVYLPFRSYEWLKRYEPMARIGYSIFVYDIRGDAVAHNELGILFLQYHRFQEAVAEFELVKKLAPQAAVAYVNLGIAQSFLANFAQAEEAFRTALGLDPDNETAKKGLEVVAGRTP
ncbi:MAG TPA: glycosyltransferase family 39 protein [Candidatus Acidoferrales bacterium]|nr:glycosyltransferase family 39 protein [Candidatus Acidoferrales bacterium]